MPPSVRPWQACGLLLHPLTSPQLLPSSWLNPPIPPFGWGQEEKEWGSLFNTTTAGEDAIGAGGRVAESEAWASLSAINTSKCRTWVIIFVGCCLPLK